MNHLAIYNSKAYGEDYIEMMLVGRKTIDSKFSYRKTAPYLRIKPGDRIYLKESSGPIRGRVTVGKVVNQELRDPEDVMSFLAPFKKELGLQSESELMAIWRDRMNKKYVCQWTMLNPERAHSPVNIFKHDMRSWVVDYVVPEHVFFEFA
jgi:hypothetical protein